MSERDERSIDRPPVRWWPAAGVLLVMLVAVEWVWMAGGLHRQARWLGTLGALTLGAVALLLWWLFASRLRRRIRLGGLALFGLVVLCGSTLLELRGVSGDVVPIIGWRGAAVSTAASAIETSPAQAVVPESPPGAGDYPQFLGPGRDAVLQRPTLARSWEERAPRVIWRRPVGEGWSAFAVSGPYAVTLEQHGTEERVSAYALADGRPLWTHRVETRHEDPLGGPGPRSTPTIVGNRVYAIGGTGRLTALTLDRGERVWEADLLAEHGAEPPTYGVSASPLVVDDRVVAVAGGRDGHSLVAYDAASGALLWAGGDDRAAYSSPVLHTLAGRSQIVLLNHDHLLAHDPQDGHVLWQVPWPGETQKVSQPVVLPDDRVFVSTGYGIGGKLFRIVERDGLLTADLIWESRGLKAKFTNVVHRDGFLYGLDDGRLVALDLTDGKRAWKGGRFGHGQLLLVGDLLLIQAEDGDIALVAAKPEGYEQLGRIEMLDRRTWNHPALAGRYLLVRNDREAVCLELPLATP